jgi:hypothetical protein
MTKMIAMLFLGLMLQAGYATWQFEGAAEAGYSFQHDFGRFTFLLLPQEQQNGWTIRVRDFHRSGDDISLLTTIGANPAQQSQDFIFSPEVGSTIDRSHSPTEREIRRIAAFGKGTMQILEHRSDKSIKFRVTLTWNPEYPAGIERYERWLGLLRIPEIWGAPDEKYRLTPVPVYAEPRRSANPIGTLQNWIKPSVANERPYPAAARFHPANTAAEPREVPSHQITYAEPAAIVLERSGRWFRILLESGSGWVERPDNIRFSTYQQLLQYTATSLTEGWTGKLWREPGQDLFEPRPEWRTAAGQSVPAEVLEWREVGGEPWIKVRLMPLSLCTPTLPSNMPTTEGWLPAYWPSGRASVWFHVSSVC